jgi:hypothetical protein
VGDGGFNLPRDCTGLCSLGVDREVMGGAMLSCLFCRFMQAALELDGGEKWHAASFSVAWCRETFRELGVQDVTEFNSD